MAKDTSVLHSLAVSGKFVLCSVVLSTLLGLFSGLLLS
jgi:ABC-type sugar transport system permease subunit